MIKYKLEKDIYVENRTYTNLPDLPNPVSLCATELQTGTYVDHHQPVDQLVVMRQHLYYISIMDKKANRA